MRREVVVVVESELSERDAGQIAGLCGAAGVPVDYHLLLADDHRAVDSGVAVIGVLPRDTFGSPAVARRVGAESITGEEAVEDFGQRIEHSARRLRGLRTGEVSVAITHGDLLAAARNLVKSTGGQEVILVVSSDDYTGFALPDRKQRLRAYLGVPQVHAIEHTT